jgi:uncharacterized membrane protein
MDIPAFIGPVEKYDHEGHVIKNVNLEFHEELTTGQRLADWVAKVVGSWPFVIYQSIIISVWIGINIFLAYKISSDETFLKAWDPYPFILLNLVLSFQAAYTGPVVMMSQNRNMEKDRIAADIDYQINQKAEEEIKVIMAHLVHQDKLMMMIMEKMERGRNNFEP